MSQNLSDAKILIEQKSNRFCTRIFQPVFDEHVRICPDEDDFLSCCECTDGCRGSGCPCKKLTITGAREINALYTVSLNDPGFEKCPYLEKNFEFIFKSYQFGRLVDIIATGIHECSRKCLCKRSNGSPCQNSLVQRGIRQEVQLFKTFKKGWGIRKRFMILRDIESYRKYVLTFIFDRNFLLF